MKKLIIASFLSLSFFGFSQDVIQTSNPKTDFYIPSKYFEGDPDSKKFEILKRYRDAKSTDGDWWWDEGVTSEEKDLGNGISSITITGERLFTKEQNILYVSEENKILLNAVFVESEFLERRFDYKIAQSFDITNPDKKYTNETIQINLPEGISINIPAVIAYRFKLSKVDTKQNFTEYIGYYQKTDTIRNRRGEIRRISKGEKKGFIIEVPTTNAQANNSQNDIDGDNIGRGFYESYLKSDIGRYIEMNTIKESGKLMMEAGLSDVVFGVKDADVPEDYIKAFFGIYIYFFDIEMNPGADVTFTSLDGDTIAVALGMNDDCVGNIAIDIDKWNEASNLEKYFIMFHELGHDIFNLSHNDGIRLMATNQFNIKNKNQLGEMIFEMFYHIEKIDIKNNCIKQ